MKKYLLAILVTTAGVGAATPALAQEASAFSGVKIEAIAGGVRDQYGVLGRNTGVVYGVAVGVDGQVGGMVAGVEAEATESTDDYCRYNQTVTGDTLCINPGRDLYIGARAGTEMMPGTLLYAKVGYTNTRTRFNYQDGGAGTTNDYIQNRGANGIRLGGGLERAFGNAFGKLEYRYSNYEDEVSKHQVVIGLGMRF